MTTNLTEWARGYRTPQKAWNVCERGDWMLESIGGFVCAQGSPEHRKLILTVVECGRLSLPYTKDKRIAQVYEDLERWARGEDVDLVATLDSARAAYCSILAARYSARIANYAARAAYYSAMAAYYAARAACYSAIAARYSAGAATDSAMAARYSAGAAWTDVLKKCADIVRKHYPLWPG